MLRPVVRSFFLLRPRERLFFSLIVAARIVVHALDLLGLAAVGVLGAMLASGLTDRTAGEFLGFEIPVDSSQNFLLVTAAIGAFFVSKSVLGTALLRVTTSFLARVEARSAIEVANYLFSGDLARARSMSKGAIQWAVTASSAIAFSAMLYAASALVAETALFLAIFAGFFFVDPGTAFLITGYFALLILVFQLSINRRIRILGERMANLSVTVNNSVLDMASAFRETTVLEKRGHFLSKFGRSRRQQAIDQGNLRFIQGLPRFLVEVALMLGIIGLIGWQFFRGNLSEGLVVTGIFLAGGTRMMAALLPLQNAITNIRHNAPQADRAQKIIAQARSGSVPQLGGGQLANRKPELSDSEGFRVSLSSVSFTYAGAHTRAVSDVSLQIEAGNFAAIVGPSGAGKSSLVDLILGVHRPDSGEIAINGRKPEEQRRMVPGSIAYVPQSSGIVSGSVAENVALGEEAGNINRDRVVKVLGMAGLSEFIDSLPDGIDSGLGEQSEALSGGQLQRLGIARALYTEPRLLVLDEATSALDAETEANISATVKALRGSTTLIVVAHRLSTIQDADVVFVMEEAGLTASGTFSDVRRLVPLIEKYVQLMKIDDPGDESPE